ncbi:MAG: PrsW family intramembrane metalloprotease [Anaerolineaceae bacterium]|nr:PrsW family intramembrane metalloprotease [Anaerolineaceae bacterium]
MTSEQIMESMVPEEPRKLHWPSIGLLVLSAFGMLISLPAAVVLLLAGFAAMTAGPGSVIEIYSLFSSAWLAFFIGLLFTPAAIYSLFRLLGKDISTFKIRGRRQITVLLLFIWPVLLYVGSLASQKEMLSWIILPPVQILVMGIPLLLMIEIGRKGLSKVNPQRKWGAISFGMTGTSFLTLLAELIALGGIAILLMAWLFMNPEWIDQLSRLGQRLMSSQLQPESLVRILSPYFESPAVILGMLSVGAGIVPILEELIKPIVLWFLIGKKMTPAEGFEMGLIAGACFAFLESMGMLLSPLYENWAGIIVGRVGTGILHTTTTALVGWGLVVAWQQRKYIQLGLAFILAVSLHAIWNTFGLLMGFVAFLPEKSFFAVLGETAPYALVVLSMAMLFILFGGNRILKNQQNDAAPIIN